MSATWKDAQRRGDSYPSDINPWDVALSVLRAGQELERQLAEARAQAERLGELLERAIEVFDEDGDEITARDFRRAYRAATGTEVAK